MCLSTREFTLYSINSQHCVYPKYYTNTYTRYLLYWLSIQFLDFAQEINNNNNNNNKKTPTHLTERKFDSPGKKKRYIKNYTQQPRPEQCIWTVLPFWQVLTGQQYTTNFIRIKGHIIWSAQIKYRLPSLVQSSSVVYVCFTADAINPF